MAGSAITFAKGDAVTSTKFKIPRTIGISGIVTGTATSFDGSANITIPITALNLQAAGITGTLPVSLGGTGATTAAGIRTNIGATTVGSNLLTLANPSAIRFLQTNADNTVQALTQTAFRTAIGGTTVGSNLFTLTNPGVVSFIRINADNTISALQDIDFRDAIQAGAGSGTQAAPVYTEIVCTAGQTVFPVIYTPTDLVVYLNGIKLNTADYTATSGTSITLSQPALVGQVLAVRSYQDVPSTNANENVVVITANTQLTTLRMYVVRQVCTLTLPSQPVIGNWLCITNRQSGSLTVLRNSMKIMGLTEDLTINVSNASITLVYQDTTDGWIIK